MFRRMSSSGPTTTASRRRPNWPYSRNRVSGKPGTVQNRASRRTAQSRSFRLTIGALKEDCLTCRFPQPQLVGEPALVCGSGTLPVVPEGGTPVTATLPFIPTAAAVMTVAELVKTTLPDYPRNVNFGCLDFLGSLGDFLTVPRAGPAGCICEGQRDLWRHVNAATTFAGLSDE
jgi:hypothetical protein